MGRSASNPNVHVLTGICRTALDQHGFSSGSQLDMRDLYMPHLLLLRVPGVDRHGSYQQNIPESSFHTPYHNMEGWLNPRRSKQAPGSNQHGKAPILHPLLPKELLEQCLLDGEVVLGAFSFVALCPILTPSF